MSADWAGGREHRAEHRPPAGFDPRHRPDGPKPGQARLPVGRVKSLHSLVAQTLSARQETSTPDTGNCGDKPREGGYVNISLFYCS